MNQNADEQIINQNNETTTDKSNEINNSMLLSTYSLDELEEQENEFSQPQLQSEDDEIEIQKVIYVCNVGTTVNGVTYAVGKDSNNGLTPQTPVKTLAKAYSLFFGGGRGVSADSNTVTGNSNVLIQGVNTNVTNYGSVK